MEFEQIKVKKIPHIIVDRIRRSIIIGTFNPGDQLPTEVELAKTFGVARSSIREALQLLEGFGVIERRKRGGTIVQQVSLEDLSNIYIPKSDQETFYDLIETRIKLEEAVVELVLERASDEEIMELEKTIDWMVKDPEKAARDDIIFHTTLARISHNHVMANIIESIKKMMDRLNKKVLEPEQISTVLEEHRKILDAIKKREKVKAQMYIREHLEKLKERVDD